MATERFIAIGVGCQIPATRFLLEVSWLLRERAEGKSLQATGKRKDKHKERSQKQYFRPKRHGVIVAPVG